MQTLEVFADVACPFAHVGLARFHAVREERGLIEPVLLVRAWPLELVNSQPFDGHALAPKVAALRAAVAADRFGGFDPERFPASSLPAMAAESAAYRIGAELGERFSLAVRHALFDDGLDVSDPEILGQLRRELGVPAPTAADEAAVQDDWNEGTRRGVRGSPHFFASGTDFFCPSLQIGHDAAGYHVSFDAVGFGHFVAAVLG